jgi:intraflagellar transport protein 122
VLGSLASCSVVDFGLWQPDGQSVNKTKTPAKCVSCDWSPDGQLLAIGLYNGVILVKDKAGQELMSIQRSSSPVWCLAFCPQKFESSDNLLVTGAWDGKLISY